MLCALCENGLTPVLFTPNDPRDFEDVPQGCTEILWLLLDYDDVRRERLRGRGWGEVRVREALEDAAIMRRLIPERLDAIALHPADGADAILTWLELDQQKS